MVVWADRPDSECIEAPAGLLESKGQYDAF